jgi:hypothetical protein
MILGFDRRYVLLPVVLSIALVVSYFYPPLEGPLYFLALSIAVSRVVLGMHSPAEVLLGLIVGASALGIFAVLYYRLNPAEMNLPLFLSLSVAVLLLLHGAHLPAEQIIRHLASILRSTTHACPGG